MKVRNTRYRAARGLCVCVCSSHSFITPGSTAKHARAHTYKECIKEGKFEAQPLTGGNAKAGKTSYQSFE